MAYISRDPFARTELHRQTVGRYLSGEPMLCDWCGSTRKDGKLFVYLTETDGGRSHTHKGHFCSKSCHDSYHS